MGKPVHRLRGPSPMTSDRWKDRPPGQKRSRLRKHPRTSLHASQVTFPNSQVRLLPPPTVMHLRFLIPRSFTFPNSSEHDSKKRSMPNIDPSISILCGQNHLAPLPRTFSTLHIPRHHHFQSPKHAPDEPDKILRFTRRTDYKYYCVPTECQNGSKP